MGVTPDIRTPTWYTPDRGRGDGRRRTGDHGPVTVPQQPPGRSGSPAGPVGATGAEAAVPAAADAPSVTSRDPTGSTRVRGPAGPTPVRDPAAGVPPPRRPRGGGTTRDIVISLVVMAVVIGGFLLVSGLWRNIRIGAGRPVQTSVDVSASAMALGSTAPFPVVTPAALPPGWAGRAATLRNGLVWHLTYLTPATRYAAVDQSAGSGTSLVEEVLPQRRATGTVRLASGTWARFTAADTADGATRSGLVQQRSGSTVVVSGTAGADELAVLAGSLRTG